MSEPSWQPNYIDLSEGDAIRLGAECVVCGARYVTPSRTIDPLLVTAALPGSSLERDLSELRFQFFKDFDTAFRDICITCYRCGRAACPDCWDEDNRMCGECVAKRELVRSPRHGPPVTGPLVDGRLERVATGRFGDAGRPPWLAQLLEAQAAMGGANGVGVSGTAASLPPGFIAPQIARRESHGPGIAGESTGFGMPTSKAFAEGSGSFVEEPTLRQSVVDDPAQPARRTSAGPALSSVEGDFQTPEGTATSKMVTCPRCGTANYDFVTRCTACQLQLIQICPLCEKLNPGHVRQCEHCGSPLDQPKEWSGIQMTIQAVPPDAVREIHNGMRTTGAPPRKPTPPPVQRAPRSSRRLRALFGGAGVADQTTQYGTPGATDAPGLVTVIMERVVSLVLAAGILLLIAGIAAAEISTRADLFIKSLIHVDIREAIAQLIQQMQVILQHLHQ